MNIFEEEMLDLVNDKDEIIGSMERNEVYKQGLSNFRVINCFIKNSEGKLWIPRRQKNKRMFPSALDVSVGGHVTSGETYDEAFVKEAREELNIDVAKLNYKVLGTLNPISDNVSAFMTIYEIESDDAPNYNKEDFTEYFWLSPKEFFQKIKDGDTSKADLPKLLRKFYS